MNASFLKHNCWFFFKVFVLLFLLTKCISASLADSLHQILDTDEEIKICYVASTSKAKGRHIYYFNSKDNYLRQLTKDSDFPNDNKIRLQYPSFTWDGNRIIFYNLSNLKVYAIYLTDFSLHEIAEGFRISETWMSSKDSSHWVLAVKEGKDTCGPLYRINIDTKEKVLLWNKSPIGNYNGELSGSLSGDGKVFAGNFPWPIKSLVEVPNGNGNRKLIDGCWVTMTNDNSLDVMHIVDHNRITISYFDLSKPPLHVKIDSLFTNLSAPSYWTYNQIRWSNKRDIFAFEIDYRTWAEMRGPCIGSFGKKKFVRIDSVGQNIDCYVYKRNNNFSIKPSISTQDTIFLFSNTNSSCTLSIHGFPVPSLTYENLPHGLIMSRLDTISKFIIHGTPLQIGTYRCRIKAVNNVGTDSIFLTFVIRNDMMSHQRQFKLEYDIKMGTMFRFLPIMEKPVFFTNQYTWQLISSSNPDVIIASPQSLLTQVDFLKSGSYTFAFCSWYKNLVTCESTTVNVLTSLPMKILSPRSNDTLIAGDTHTITWQTDPPMRVVITYSIDNGKSLIPISELASYGGTKVIENYQWNIHPEFNKITEAFLQIDDYNFSSTGLRIRSEKFFIKPLKMSGAKTIKNPPIHYANNSIHENQIFDIKGRRILLEYYKNQKNTGIILYKSNQRENMLQFRIVNRK